MFKVLLKGLVFGLGALIALSIGVVGYKLFQAYDFGPSSDPTQHVDASGNAVVRPVRANFGEMPVEQQITEASVIFVTRFEPGEDGRQKAIISEILKSPSSGAFPFKLGDEYGRLSVYPGDSNDYGEGYVTFMTGERPEFQFSTTIRDGRVGGYGGIPLDKLRQKIPDA